ncbi:hypothetical protein JCM19294_1123 [Nonlabens tegetincola]|uniref:Uncharacterized protein n=1 Tax=Nonlabens tegetincola TaxID=323273 RepID=A0A090Q148_9FLAO|nr:DUF6712 family protein [Nonlabens tegetincola]GAK96814.1 hypothetical protein JCM19294_1123 [Nonlabens tegetincola]
MRRAYKALDRLIDLLNKIELKEWIDSKAFTASKELLIQSTDDLDKIEPINNSGQLYYRLVAYMQLAEIEHVNPILDNETLTIIKTGTDLDANQKLVRLHAQRLTAYTALADAYQTFPLEMFPGDINYAAGANYKHTVTGNKTLFYKERAQSTALALQNAYQALKGYEQTYSLPDNSDTSKKFINL